MRGKPLLRQQLWRHPRTGELAYWHVRQYTARAVAGLPGTTMPVWCVYLSQDFSRVPWYYVRPAVELAGLQSGDRGLGLFAARDFKKGDLIAVYEGQRISMEEQRTKVKAGGGHHTVKLSGGVLVDGENARLLAQCANTKRGIAARHNAALKLSTKDRGVALLRAVCKIREGQQVLIPYGRGYFTREVLRSFS